jgi:two-component system chemotaxis response regulator CheB
LPITIDANPKCAFMRILIADHSTEISKRLGEMLAEIPGADIVGFAADVVATLDAVRRLRPDVLTLDLRMLGGSGLDMLHELRGG